MDETPGILALVGGGEWQEGCDFDADLLAASGSEHVLVLPTAAAYEHPERLVLRAGEWFTPLGGQVEGLMVLSRADAENDGAADIMRRARLIYLAGSSPMHIRSVLKKSAVWDALVAAWLGGAVVVGSSGAAMALTDPMVDARGGGLTIGLGLSTGSPWCPTSATPPRTSRAEDAPLGAARPAGTRRWSAFRSGRPSSGNRTGRGARRARARWRSSSTGHRRRRTRRTARLSGRAAAGGRQVGDRALSRPR